MALLKKQIEIIQRSIKEDQHAIAQQWYKTFKHNRGDPATNMAAIMLACIARGEFRTRSTLLIDSNFSAPRSSLTCLDYMSHASRVIIDYQKLSNDNKNMFLSYFPKAGVQGVFARSATHSVIRRAEDSSIEEIKGFMYGLRGQMPEALVAPKDFGVNIAMGGLGQQNFIGKTISCNGFSGHMYFHHSSDPSQQLLMVGLEQSAPTSLHDLFYGHYEQSDEDVQQHTDQFGQGHSMVGASDTFTAAGSLYFSNPVQVAKYLVEEGCPPPEKYEGMVVTLTDSNWPQVQGYLAALNKSLDHEDAAIRLLKQAPASCLLKRYQAKDFDSFIAIEFKDYLKHISILLKENSAEVLDDEFRQQHDSLQQKLLRNILVLQSGEGNKQQALKVLEEVISEICSTPDTPKNYCDAIERISTLFRKQLEIDPELKETHCEILIERKTVSLLDRIAEMKTKAINMQCFYKSEYIASNPEVENFISEIENHLTDLSEFQAQLNWSESVDSEQGQGDLQLKNSMLDSFHKMKKPTLECLNTIQDHLQVFSNLLDNPPILITQQALSDQTKVYREMIGDLQARLEATMEASQRVQDGLNTRISELESAITKKDAELKDLHKNRDQQNVEFEEQVNALKEQQNAVLQENIIIQFAADQKDVSYNTMSEANRSSFHKFALHHPYLQKLNLRIFSALDQEIDYLANHPKDDLNNIKRDTLTEAKTRLLNAVWSAFENSDNKNNIDILQLNENIEAILHEYAYQNNDLGTESSYLGAFFRYLAGVTLGLCSGTTLFFNSNFRDRFFGNHQQASVNYASRCFKEDIESVLVAPVA